MISSLRIALVSRTSLRIFTPRPLDVWSFSSSCEENGEHFKLLSSITAHAKRVLHRNTTWIRVQCQKRTQPTAIHTPPSAPLICIAVVHRHTYGDHRGSNRSSFFSAVLDPIGRSSPRNVFSSRMCVCVPVSNPTAFVKSLTRTASARSHRQNRRLPR